jgi:hypothetical protein
VIYFVRIEELRAVALHNTEVEQQIAVLRKEEREIHGHLRKMVHDLKAELLEQLAQNSRLESRFAVIGPLLDIPTLEAFRAKVGKTRPSTYVPQLVTLSNMGEVFRRMNRGTEVNWMERTNERIVQIAQQVKDMEATKRLPTAAERRFGIA